MWPPGVTVYLITNVASTGLISMAYPFIICIINIWCMNNHTYCCSDKNRTCEDILLISHLVRSPGSSKKVYITWIRLHSSIRTPLSPEVLYANTCCLMPRTHWALIDHLSRTRLSRRALNHRLRLWVAGRCSLWKTVPSVVIVTSWSWVWIPGNFMWPHQMNTKWKSIYIKA